jgi:hypothetical protein
VLLKTTDVALRINIRRTANRFREFTMSEEELPEGFHEIWNLIGKFSAAFWRRISDFEGGVYDAKKVYNAAVNAKDDVYPKSAEEIEVWSELTAPQHHEALKRYVNYKRKQPVNEYAARLHDALYAESARRFALTQK